MSLAAGDRLGPYELLAPIGAGGMGVVWKARDTRLDRTVAVKVSQEKFSDRFDREARAVAALNHPNICTLHDVGPNYLVMEFIEGSPIKGPLPTAKAIEYARQILDALDVAHKKGITHRDLKPGNILLTKQGIKLLDFGLARMTPGPDDSTLTQTGAVMGTPAYMAPEQWEGKLADARSDIFAFGCVLYEMLSGKRATPDRKPLESAALESIVKTCLEKDPEDRWQSARDIKRALALPAGQSAAAKPSRAVLWIATAVVLLAAIGSWALFRSRPPAEEMQAYRVQLALPENGALAFTPSNSNTLALSPDGRRAAFVVEMKGKTGVWIQELDGISARPLQGSEGAVLVLWSPDSKSVAFRAQNKLFRSDLTTGSPVFICEMPAGPTWGADWGTDGASAGSILFEGNGTIFQVPASGGTAVVLSASDANTGGARNSPRMLPGGRFLFTTVASPGVFGASLDHPDRRVQILSQSATPLYETGPDGKGYLVWTRDNTLVAQEFDSATLRLAGEAIAIAPARNVTASAKLLLYDASTPMSQFAWVDGNGKELQTVGEPGSFTFTGLSRDGARVAVTVNTGNTAAAANKIDLWLLETQRGGFSKFTFSPGIHLSPVWSPDDRTIVFGSGTGLVRKPSNGLGEEGKVLPYDRLLNPSDWSRTGTILFTKLATAPATTGLDVWMLPVTPDGKATGDPKPYLDGPSDQDAAKFSPDGGWVAYQSNDSGQWEIYVDTFPKLSGRQQVSRGGGFGPRWNPKGGELFYRSLDGKLMAAAIRLGINVDKTSAVVSPSHMLFPMLVNAPAFGNAVYDAGPDGRFLIQIPAKQAPPLNMIVNWTALLKKQAASR